MKDKEIIEKPEIEIKVEDDVPYLEIKIPKQLEKEIEKKVISASGALVTK